MKEKRVILRNGRDGAEGARGARRAVAGRWETMKKEIKQGVGKPHFEDSGDLVVMKVLAG